MRAVLVGHRSVVLAELLADRLHLLAQEVLALLALGALLHVVADLGPHLQLGEPLALQLERTLEPLGDVEGLEQADLVAQADVGRVAGRVRQRAGPGDGAQEGPDARVRTAQVEDLLDHRAVFALDRPDAARRSGSASSWTVTSTRSVPAASVWAAPGTPRATPSTTTAVPPPGMRMRSTTSATVPTLANSPSVRGTSRTRSSSPVSTARVAVIPGKRIESSRGTRVRFSIGGLFRSGSARSRDVESIIATNGLSPT